MGLVRIDPAHFTLRTLIFSLLELDQDVLEPFRIDSIPVSVACRPLRDAIRLSHRFNPLCASEQGANSPILPAEYGPKLRGAIVEARFTISHKIISRTSGPTSHFTATIDEIIILGNPDVIELSPSKSRYGQYFLKRKHDSTSTSESNATGPNKAAKGGATKKQRKN
jgi:hypothetical protein